MSEYHNTTVTDKYRDFIKMIVSQMMADDIAKILSKYNLEEKIIKRQSKFVIKS